MWTAFIDTLVLTTEEEIAGEKLSILESLDEVPRAHLERLRDGGTQSVWFKESTELRERVNSDLQRHGVEAIWEAPPAGPGWDDDDLPF